MHSVYKQYLLFATFQAMSCSRCKDALVTEVFWKTHSSIERYDMHI